LVQQLYVFFELR